MYAILKEQVASYALQDQVVKVVRVEDYSIPSGMLESIFTAAGQLMGSDGASSPVVIAAPAVEGDILRARLGLTAKMAFETVDLAQLVQTAVKTAAYTAINNDHVLVDASGAGADFEIALPATPADGTKVRVTLVAEHATYKVTINRNGSLVNGGTSVTDLSLVKKGDTVYFEYTGATLGWGTLPKSVHTAINTATAKTTPVNADRFGFWDSVSELLNHVTWANIKATLFGATINLTGGQIAFPATQNPSADANTLDDYEEKPWTPAQGAGLTVVGAFSSSGLYTKSGRQVTVTGVVTGATSVAVTAGGVITNNLPFSVSGTPPAAAVGSGTNAALTANISVLVSTVNVYACGAITATTNIYFSATYFV